MHFVGLSANGSGTAPVPPVPLQPGVLPKQEHGFAFAGGSWQWSGGVRPVALVVAEIAYPP